MAGLARQAMRNKIMQAKAVYADIDWCCRAGRPRKFAICRGPFKQGFAPPPIRIDTKLKCERYTSSSGLLR